MDSMEKREALFLEQASNLLFDSLERARQLNAQMNEIHFDISSLANRLSVSRPTIYSRPAVLELYDFYNSLFPSIKKRGEIEKLRAKTKELELEKKAFLERVYKEQYYKNQYEVYKGKVHEKEEIIKALQARLNVLETGQEKKVEEGGIEVRRPLSSERVSIKIPVKGKGEKLS